VDDHPRLLGTAFMKGHGDGHVLRPHGRPVRLARFEELVETADRVLAKGGVVNGEQPLPGRVEVHEDPLRIDYLRKHIKAIHAAMQSGVDLRGYFVWSLLDNLEWSLGYSKRFGIVHVDFASLKRTPKDSAHFYSKVIATNGLVLNEPAHAALEEALAHSTAGL